MRGAALIRGNAIAIPLRAESVDLIVTSPPYFALRSYRDAGEHYDGQIGSEPTPQAFLEALWSVMSECWRVLKPTGVCFVNLGDKRSQRVATRMSSHQDGLFPGRPDLAKDWKRDKALGLTRMPNQNTVAGSRNSHIREKSKMLLPHRFAIGCEDGLANPEGKGWIVRQDMVWCLSGGARVYARTPTGARPVMLRDLVRAYQPEEVQLWNGERWTQVLGWNETPRPDDALEVELRSGQRIGCTRNHQWPTARGLVEAGNLRIGDVIDTCRLPEPTNPRTPSGLPDADTGWFVGLYMAEGSRSGKMIQFAGHLEERARLERLRRIATAYDGQANVYQTSEAGATINLSGAVLHGILNRYLSGTSAKNKRLRFTVWQRSDEFLSGVLAGYLEGDGHFDAKNQRWRLGFTRNDEWAADLRTLCARLGLPLRLARRTARAFGKDWPIWKGDLRLERSAHANARKDGEVVALRASRARHFYDVGVADEPHTFALASGVLTHNSKPNGLPESVTDRTRDSHEYWFMLCKEGRYYSAMDEIREGYAPATAARYASGFNVIAGEAETSKGYSNGDGGPSSENPLGKMPGSVWRIPSEPLRVPDHLNVDHFAAFPTEWPRRLILGWSPSGICVECGEGRRPMVEKDTPERHEWAQEQQRNRAAPINGGVGKVNLGISAADRRTTITGEACSCPSPDASIRPAVVLDPFAGTGTVPMVARTLGRFGVGLDLSADYLRLARWRVWESGHGSKAEQRTWKDRQGSLLGTEDEDRYLRSSGIDAMLMDDLGWPT